MPTAILALPEIEGWEIDLEKTHRGDAPEAISCEEVPDDFQNRTPLAIANGFKSKGRFSSLSEATNFWKKRAGVSEYSELFLLFPGVYLKRKGDVPEACVCGEMGFLAITCRGGEWDLEAIRAVDDLREHAQLERLRIAVLQQ